MQLMLLFHGVGGSPQDLKVLGECIAHSYPNALIVSVAAPLIADNAPHGFQWFSIRGITEENRVARVAAAMPAFVEHVQHWQQRANVSAEQTALIGFSQGAIMCLEATQTDSTLAGRVIALCGRFATTASKSRNDTTLHLIHGEEDAVIPYRYAVEAATQLIAINADVTADIVPHVGHTITNEIAQLAVHRLRSYVPKRTWNAALQGRS
jgi:phospholipase/carboxylesterase